MNERQQQLRNDFEELFGISTKGASFSPHSADLRTAYDFYLRAYNLLADEPEKELKDYTLAELAELVHDMAKEKGWWKGTRDWPEIACLIHSEISEAVERYRDGELAMHFINGKPEGMVVELADVVIRCLDYLASKGLHTGHLYRETAAWWIGTTKSPIGRGTLDAMHSAHTVLGYDNHETGVYECIKYAFQAADCLGVDLASAIVAKIEYNATRPYRHGGKKA